MGNGERDELLLTGQQLRIRDVVRVARSAPGTVRVALDDGARARVRRSREAVARLVEEGRVAYGITTGFGAFKDRVISREQLATLQRNLVLSHAFYDADVWERILRLVSGWSCCT